MRLKSLNYISPDPKEGKFDEVFIEERLITIEKARKYILIDFEMYYFKDGIKIQLDTRSIAFYGEEGDESTSNKTSYISILNPEYNSEIEGSEERITVSLLPYLYSHAGILPEDYQVVEWGYPSYTDVCTYFRGGDKDNMDIHIDNPFARAWLRYNFVMKGEPIANQFNFIEE